MECVVYYLYTIFFIYINQEIILSVANPVLAEDIYKEFGIERSAQEVPIVEHQWLELNEALFAKFDCHFVSKV